MATPPAPSVRVGERELTATTVILAAGSVPRAIPGVELGGRVLGTEEAWALGELPARLAVVGAGASGAEIASAFARLGSEVLLLEALDRVLPSEDADISRLVERGLKRQGIGVHTSTPIESSAAVGVERDLHLWSRVGRGRLSRDRRRARTGHPGARPGRGRRRPWTSGGWSGRRRAAHERDRASMRSATSSPGRRSRTRPPTRASSRSRTPPACRPIRSPTSTSRAQRSARRTSARSA